MLEVRDLSAAYGPHPALNDVSITVDRGEIVVILGANGAGKSTLLRAIAGICDGQVTGDIALGGATLRGLTSDQIVECGVALVPEGRGIFGDLTVRENLLLGAYPARARAGETQNLARVLDLFPKLRERQSQVARTMSGGEQQMVAIGRAMMSAPEILMLDEPSLGLSPLLCKELFQNLSAVKALGIGVLLVEQNAKQSLAIADRGYLLENTQITHEDNAAKLANDPAVQQAYLGAAGAAAPQPKTPIRADEGPLPPTPPPTPVPAPRQDRRRTADQQIGFSIEDIVAKAADASSARPSTSVKTAADQLAQDRLSTVLKDIEEAAARARTRRAAVRSRSEPTPPAKTTRDEPAPVIEIYRRPRVEVYRRRASGTFERD